MTGIVFDLDGTLAESAPAICAIANELMAELGLPPLDVDEARSYVGNGAARFLERALEVRGGCSPEDFKVHFARFTALYEAAPPEANEPMPGAGEALRALAAAGHRLALCTNKPMVPTRSLLKAFGWEDLFAVVIAGDSLPERKPHPAPLLKAAADLDEPAPLYVGDSEVDAATAEAANVPFVIYARGYRQTPLEEITHAASFDTFGELPGLIDTLAAERRSG